MSRYAPTFNRRDTGRRQTAVAQTAVSADMGPLQKAYYIMLIANQSGLPELAGKFAHWYASTPKAERQKQFQKNFPKLSKGIGSIKDTLSALGANVKDFSKEKLSKIQESVEQNPPTQENISVLTNETKQAMENAGYGDKIEEFENQIGIDADPFTGTSEDPSMYDDADVDWGRFESVDKQPTSGLVTKDGLIGRVPEDDTTGESVEYYTQSKGRTFDQRAYEKELESFDKGVGSDARQAQREEHQSPSAVELAKMATALVTGKVVRGVGSAIEKVKDFGAKQHISKAIKQQYPGATQEGREQLEQSRFDIYKQGQPLESLTKVDAKEKKTNAFSNQILKDAMNQFAPGTFIDNKETVDTKVLSDNVTPTIKNLEQMNKANDIRQKANELKATAIQNDTKFNQILTGPNIVEKQVIDNALATGYTPPGEGFTNTFGAKTYQEYLDKQNKQVKQMTNQFTKVQSFSADVTNQLGPYYPPKEPPVTGNPFLQFTEPNNIFQPNKEGY